MTPCGQDRAGSGQRILVLLCCCCVDKHTHCIHTDTTPSKELFTPPSPPGGSKLKLPSLPDNHFARGQPSKFCKNHWGLTRGEAVRGGSSGNRTSVTKLQTCLSSNPSSSAV